MKFKNIAILLFLFFATKNILSQSLKDSSFNNSDTIQLSKQEYYIKRGLGLTEKQAKIFFVLDRKRTQLIDSIFKNMKNANNDKSFSRSSQLLNVNSLYLKKMKAILNSNQLLNFDALEDARRRIILNRNRILKSLK